MIASPTISSPRQEITHRNWGDTEDIIRVIMEVVNKTELSDQVEQFSKHFKDKRDQVSRLAELWQWVRDEIPYIPDPDGLQSIKHPGRTWADAQEGRGADCKSMTVFVRFVLYNIGIPHRIRFASYTKGKRIQHVYIVAMLGGTEIIIDPVHDTFNEEVPYTSIRDITPTRMTKIVEIAGITQPGAGPVLLARPWFSLSTMTEGEARLAIDIRAQELKAAIVAGKESQAQAKQRALIIEEMNEALISGIHTGRRNWRNVPKEYSRMLWPCCLSHMVLGTPGKSMIGSTPDFTPDATQRAYCEQQARTRTNNEAMQNGNPPWTSTGAPPFQTWRDGRVYATVYRAYMDKCMELKEMENMVNEYLLDAGMNFLYAQFGSGNYNNIISVKLVNQQSWVYTSSQATGLSENVIRGLMRVGIMEQLASKGYGDVADPLVMKGVLQPHMTPGGIGGAAIGDFGITAIIALVTTIATLVGAGVNLVRSFQAASRANELWDGRPDPNDPNTRIREDDFTGLQQVDQQGNPLPGGGTGPGPLINPGTGPGVNESGLGFNLGTKELLIAAAAFAAYQATRSK